MGTRRSVMKLFLALLLTIYLTAAAPIQDGPHQCSTTQPVQVYKLNDAIWCETFCIPTSLVKTVEQFGDVLNGSCTQHAYTRFDHSIQTYLYGANITVDMYKSSAPAAEGGCCAPKIAQAPTRHASSSAPQITRMKC